MIRVTVFTPTYNRAHTLERTYESLKKQPLDLFEWLIVDDGSTDNTPELLERLTASAPFPIRVLRQTNGGKHRAHNVAMKQARGELIIVLDSDDEVLPDAVQLLVSEWDAIPAQEKTRFAGVLGHSVSSSGELIGRGYGASHVDGRLIELVASRMMVGDKLPCYSADILRAHPFPEKPGDNGSVLEGTVWAAIGRKYLVRCINKPVRIYHINEVGSLNNINMCPAKNSWGKSQYFAEVLNQSQAYLPKFIVFFCQCAVHYVRSSLHAGEGLRGQSSKLSTAPAKALWLAALPLGFCVFVYDRLSFDRKQS